MASRRHGRVRAPVEEASRSASPGRGGQTQAHDLRRARLWRSTSVHPRGRGPFFRVEPVPRRGHSAWPKEDPMPSRTLRASADARARRPAGPASAAPRHGAGGGRPGPTGMRPRAAGEVFARVLQARVGHLRLARRTDPCLAGVVDERHCRAQPACQPVVLDPLAQIGLLRKEEEALVETADRLECLPAHRQDRPGGPVEVVRCASSSIRPVRARQVACPRRATLARQRLRPALPTVGKRWSDGHSRPSPVTWRTASRPTRAARRIV